MTNFYTDNDDIRFLFRYYKLTELAEIMEGDFSDGRKIEWAPENAEDAVDNYDRILDTIGQLAGDYIEPRSEAVDLEGNTLNEDGTVTRAQGTQDNLRNLAEAQVGGFTLPHRFGGLNCPNLVYIASIEIVSRADASLMNLYGLQGIAETINAFADEEIKQQYLPGFSDSRYTGAMVLTEPDAGSDLQAIKTAAHVYQDDEGNWFLHGVKRFITNGCGEVLLVLARSELERSGGLGLSLFICKSGPTVQVRRLENKLGIHGSPTCELFFNNTPCQLIGERQRGLVTYVMSLMNGARVGIAAQALGIAEAAFRVARDYAASREQFGVAIESFPAVRDMLVEMKLDVEAARTLTYETCWHVDHENGVLRKAASGEVTDKAEKKKFRMAAKKLKRLNAMLTPMSKYYASEMSNRVAYDAIQVLGGSGYMKDYPVERYARDARITTIYEGTSQLQIIAAVRGVCNGTAEKFLLEMEQSLQDLCSDEAKDLPAILQQGREQLIEAVSFTKEQPGTEYMDLQGRKLVDAAIMLIVGHLFLRQSLAEPAWEDEFTTESIPVGGNGNGSDNQSEQRETPDAYRTVRRHKAVVARRYITGNANRIKMLSADITRHDRSSMTEYEEIVGQLP
ncbi:MAG: acyl-CoA dehydrogenase family protein [Sedimentisphaerales bacterium]|nr:acyl-CoA dehydrogenase family protein [Sedimentisphaerales bacterium]